MPRGRRAAHSRQDLGAGLPNREPQVAGDKPVLPGGEDENTIKLVDDVLNAVVDLKDRVLDTYLPRPGRENADVVSLAVTILQRAIGKNIVLVDPETGRSDRSLTAAVLWRPPAR